MIVDKMSVEEMTVDEMIRYLFENFFAGVILKGKKGKEKVLRHSAY
jgi:hypothetical protein